MKIIPHVVAAAALSTLCGWAQAGQQYHVHETFIGGDVFDGVLTFANNFETIESVLGTLNSPSQSPMTVNGLWDTSYITYDAHTKGVALTGPDGFPDGYLLDISWRYANAPSLGLPVFVTDSYQDDQGWHYFYNNSINGSNYATSATITAVPEPGEYALLLTGLGVLGWTARRRKRS